MKITLKELSIKMFKGIREMSLDFKNTNAVISGENGVGKTTVYDAFLWLLFGKDSEGKTDFGIRPLDQNNKPLKDVIVQVIANVDFDGIVYNLRKEQHEKVTKGDLVGYESLCYINDVPRKVGKYNRQIEDLVPEGIFKVLTDLRYFVEKLSWGVRRKVLLELAGDTGKPEGFEDLVAALGNCKLEELKKRLTEQKKRFIKDRNDIPPRIDELQKGISDLSANDSIETVKAQRETLKAEIDNYEARINAVIEKQKIRQEQLEHLIKMKMELSNREALLISEPGGNQYLYDERTKLESSVADAHSKSTSYEQKIKELRAKKETAETILAGYQNNLEKIRDLHHKLMEAKVVTNCSMCGQVLPTERIEEMREKRESELKSLSEEGEEAQKQVEEQSNHIEQIDMQVGSAVKMHSEAVVLAGKMQAKAEARLKEISEILLNRNKPDPKQDLQWKAIKEKYDQAKEKLEPETSEELIQIEKERNEKNAQLKALNETLAQSDRIEKDKARIIELEENEKQLAQSIADVDKQLTQISEYEEAESHLIEQSVNSKFKSVKFKLFRQLLNGGLESCCDILLDGTPWPDMSSGEKIFAGLDIVNVLSMHYGYSLPLFIDHIESVTLPLDTHMQTIKLKAVEGQQIKIENEK